MTLVNAETGELVDIADLEEATNTTQQEASNDSDPIGGDAADHGDGLLGPTRTDGGRGRFRHERAGGDHTGRRWQHGRCFGHPLHLRRG